MALATRADDGSRLRPWPGRLWRCAPRQRAAKPAPKAVCRGSLAALRVTIAPVCPSWPRCSMPACPVTLPRREQLERGPPAHVLAALKIFAARERATLQDAEAFASALGLVLPAEGY